MAFSSSSEQIVLISSSGGPIIVYEPSSGKNLTQFTGSQSPRGGVTLVGSSLIAVSHISSTAATGLINFYNWSSSTPQHHASVPEPVAPLATTPDGFYLFAGGISGKMYILELPSGEIIKSFTAHGKSVSCIKVIDDGSLLISGSEDGVVVVSTIFKILSGLNDSVLHQILAHSGPVTAVTSTNTMIVSCSSDCKVKFWSLLQGTHLHTVNFPCPISSLAMDPTECQFYVAGSDGFVYRGESNQAFKLATWGKNHGSPVLSVAMMNEGRQLISASENGCVWIWEVKRGMVSKVLSSQMVGISDIVVAKKKGNDDDEYENLDLSDIWFSPLRGVTEMRDVLLEMENDRSRSIDMLESVIGMYERMLELILKEAREGNCSNSGDDK